MRTITGLLLIIFSENMMIDCFNENIITVTYEYLSIEAFEENRFIERTGDNSIIWKADADNKIYVFLGIEATVEILDFDYLCHETSTEGPEMDKHRDDLVTFFLAQGKPCPIMKGTTSNLENQKIELQRWQLTSKCGSNTGELFLFDYIQGQKLIMTINLNVTNTGCQ